MNLWSSLRSLFSVAANNSTSSRKGKKALELKPRNHLIEQCEDRVLLSVSPTGLDDVYGSESIRQAIITASNLDRYDSVDMSSVTKWVVGVTNRTDISAMAGKYGREHGNIGRHSSRCLCGFGDLFHALNLMLCDEWLRSRIIKTNLFH